MNSRDIIGTDGDLYYFGGDPVSTGLTEVQVACRG
jgi:hypothetical protein